MATLYTHAFVGVALAKLCFQRRLPLSFWILSALLPSLPDFDVLSTARYGSDLGHRGVSHSFLSALLVGLFAALLTFRRFKVRFTLLWLFFFAITASHSVLDALTRGGEGVPLLWPLDFRFGPWGPLPVSDIAFEWPNPYRSRAIRAELLWVWLPLSALTGLIMLWRRVK